jgi:tetratricopeptide (TPR) repeat protein
MQEGIKRGDAGRIITKLHECRVYLQKDNVYSCLLSFKEVIEKVRTTKMLPQDEKLLRNDINSFQKDLSESKGFRALYGPVTFMDDDLDTAHDFMKQLIQIKEEEIMESLAKARSEEGAAQETIDQRIDRIMVFVERGDDASARKMAEQDEEAADALIEIYNTSGIQLRQEQDFEKAVQTFRKALFIRPEDEGLYYNMARAYIEAGDWKAAKNTMKEALEKCPEFKEGIALLAFIDKNIR